MSNDDVDILRRRNNKVQGNLFKEFLSSCRFRRFTDIDEMGEESHYLGKKRKRKSNIRVFHVVPEIKFYIRYSQVL